MRLFVAVEPPASALEHLQAYVDAVRRSSPDLRWAGPERWHLTLAFLGEVSEPVLEDLRIRLARACTRHPPLELAVTGAGRFDGRVLWVGLGGDSDRLGRLADSVAAAARRAGIPTEERRFRPHLTLARARQPVDLRPLVTALSAYDGPQWRAERVHLVRSMLGRSPRYADVDSWALTGRGAAATGEDTAADTGDDDSAQGADG